MQVKNEPCVQQLRRTSAASLETFTFREHPRVVCHADDDNKAVSSHRRRAESGLLMMLMMLNYRLSLLEVSHMPNCINLITPWHLTTFSPIIVIL